jgi:streptomycin 6-kinase
LICNPDQDDLTTVFSTASRMRNRGLIVSVQPRKKDMRKQLDALIVQGFTSFAVFKDDGNNLEIKEFNQSP